MKKSNILTIVFAMFTLLNLLTGAWNQVEAQTPPQQTIKGPKMVDRKVTIKRLVVADMIRRDEKLNSGDLKLVLSGKNALGKYNQKEIISAWLWMKQKENPSAFTLDKVGELFTKHNMYDEEQVISFWLWVRQQVESDFNKEKAKEFLVQNNIDDKTIKDVFSDWKRLNKKTVEEAAKIIEQNTDLKDNLNLTLISRYGPERIISAWLWVRRLLDSDFTKEQAKELFKQQDIEQFMQQLKIEQATIDDIAQPTHI